MPHASPRLPQRLVVHARLASDPVPVPSLAGDLPAAPAAALHLARSLPGRVVGHGEHPGRAALDVLAAATPEAGGPRPVTRLREVFSEVGPDPERGAPVHTIRAVYEVRAAGGCPVRALDLGSTDRPGAEGDPADDSGDGSGDGSGGSPAGAPRVQRLGAYVVVAADGRVLLARNAADGRWSLPGGGIDPGEEPDAAARREVSEETAQTLVELRLREIESVRFTGHAPHGRLEDYHGLCILFTGSVRPGREPEVLDLGGSTDAAAWIPLADLSGLRLTRLARRVLAVR